MQLCHYNCKRHKQKRNPIKNGLLNAKCTQLAGNAGGQIATTIMRTCKLAEQPEQAGSSVMRNKSPAQFPRSSRAVPAHARAVPAQFPRSSRAVIKIVKRQTRAGDVYRRNQNAKYVHSKVARWCQLHSAETNAITHICYLQIKTSEQPEQAGSSAI